MQVLLLTLAMLGLLVLAVSLVLHFVFKRPLREIISDWLAQFF